FGDALTHETNKQLEILEVNGTAVIELTLEAARTMISAGKQGIILNVSSSAGEFPVTPGLTLYSATKAMVSYFSQSFDIEVRPFGIRILAAAPGLVGTHFRERAGGEPEPPYIQKTFVMTPEYVAKQIWHQIEKEKPFHVFDRKTKFFAFITRNLLPRSWVGKT